MKITTLYTFTPDFSGFSFIVSNTQIFPIYAFAKFCGVMVSDITFKVINYINNQLSKLVNNQFLVINYVA